MFRNLYFSTFFFSNFEKIRTVRKPCFKKSHEKLQWRERYKFWTCRSTLSRQSAETLFRGIGEEEWKQTARKLDGLASIGQYSVRENPRKKDQYPCTKDMRGNCGTCRFRSDRFRPRGTRRREVTSSRNRGRKCTVSSK